MIQFRTVTFHINFKQNDKQREYIIQVLSFYDMIRANCPVKVLLQKSHSEVPPLQQHTFFSVLPTSPNLIFCSIKMAPSATSIYVMTLYPVYSRQKIQTQTCLPFVILCHNDSTTESAVLGLVEEVADGKKILSRQQTVVRKYGHA